MGFSLLVGATAFPLVNAPAVPAHAQAALAAAPVTVTTPAPAAGPSHVVALTGYNAVPEQTDDNPFETASGAYSNPEIIAARSQDLGSELPFGTIIELNGSTITSSKNDCGYGAVAPLIGYRVIEDTMNARYTDRLDVLFGTDATYVSPNGHERNAADVLGNCHGVTYHVVGHVSIKHLPKTQAELAALVEKQSTPLAVK